MADWWYTGVQLMADWWYTGVQLIADWCPVCGRLVVNWCSSAGTFYPAGYIGVQPVLHLCPAGGTLVSSWRYIGIQLVTLVYSWWYTGMQVVVRKLVVYCYSAGGTQTCSAGCIAHQIVCKHVHYATLIVTYLYVTVI